MELIGVADRPTTIRKQAQSYLNPKKWEVYRVKDINFSKTVEYFFQKTKGLKYDNRAILLSNIFNRGEEDKDKYTCSEWVSELINEHYGFIYPKWFSKFSPQDVLEVLLDKELAVKVELNKEGKIK